MVEHGINSRVLEIQVKTQLCLAIITRQTTPKTIFLAVLTLLQRSSQVFKFYLQAQMWLEQLQFMDWRKHKMARPIEAITNAQTGETIYQEMSEESFAIYSQDREADKIAAIAKAAEEEKIATDKATLFAKLGIDADEAKLLLS